MSRVHATLDVDDALLNVLRRAAAEDGVAPSDLLDEALRRYRGLRGLAVLDDLAPRDAPDRGLTEDAAMELAVSEIRAARSERRTSAST